ncbi:MAG: peptidoglycan bridge formation protein FemAB [Candidatus Dojkabacteria bacterium]|nr:MAG: peptidoglycan bridge formation protein FemAB [Candidatus Dojkabacteria bacterium]
MKYSFELVDNIATTSWDRFVNDYPRSKAGIPRTTFIQSSYWKQIHDNLNIPSISFVVKDSTGEIIGGGIGIEVYAKRGKYLYFRNGPLIDWSNEILAQQTIGFLKQLSKQKGLWFVRISPLIEDGTLEAKVYKKIKAVNTPIASLEGLDTWVSSIGKLNPDLLLSSFKKKTRYEVKKALKNCTFEIHEDSQKFEEFYEILQSTAQRNNWKPFPKDFIKEELDVFSKAGKASLILAKYKEKYVAGAMFIHYAQQTCYHHSGSLAEFKNLSAPYGIIWHAYLEAFKHNSTHFNFWGLAPKNSKSTHPWQGLSQFKQKFPGQLMQWIPAKDIPTSSLYFFTNFYEKIEKRKKRY